MDTEKYRDECIRQLFRLKMPAYSEPLTNFFDHYDGLDDFVRLENVPEVELARILMNQSELSYVGLTHILKELYVGSVQVSSNQFHETWNPYHCTFREFLNEHKYVRAWDADSPSHSPDTILVMYCD